MNEYTVIKNEMYTVKADSKTDAITMIKNFEEHFIDQLDEINKTVELFSSSVYACCDDEIENKGCEYCRNVFDKQAEYNGSILLPLLDCGEADSNIWISEQGTILAGDIGEFRIKYCPMCGEEF